MSWAISIAIAYVVGSIPFGVLLGRLRGIDIRTQGSRNIGATNVGRVLGRRMGTLCFVLDLAKGAGPVIGAGLFHELLGSRVSELSATDMLLWMAVATATVIGHMASVFLRFAGGKGVATTFGALLAMWPLMTLATVGALVTWYVTLRISRFVSLASIVSAASLPLWFIVSAIPAAGPDGIGDVVRAWPPVLVTGSLAVLVLWRHRANIARLRRGEEPRAGERAPGT